MGRVEQKDKLRQRQTDIQRENSKSKTLMLERERERERREGERERERIDQVNDVIRDNNLPCPQSKRVRVSKGRNFSSAASLSNRPTTPCVPE